MSFHRSVGHSLNKKVYIVLIRRYVIDSSLNRVKFKYSGTAIDQNLSNEKLRVGIE